MAGKSAQTTATDPRRSAWELARRQHGVVTRRQLLGLGLTKGGIEHRVARGRLHPVGRGIYAVGRPELTRKGRLMAAVLACGGQGKAAISHASAAALLGIAPEPGGPIEVTRASRDSARVQHVRVHRRVSLRPGWWGLYEGIPVTSPAQTLIDIATRLGAREMERATNEADRLGLVRTDALREALEAHPGEEGVARLRQILDRRTFRYTRSELERDFLPLARAAGLPMPQTSIWLNGHEVDFFFAGLGLVVETDGLTYHRTAAQQAKDEERDQDHTAAGLTPLRFSHGQIKFEPERVRRVLAATARTIATRLNG
jgi:very-short-patch-repair endonuclease